MSTGARVLLALGFGLVSAFAQAPPANQTTFVPIDGNSRMHWLLVENLSPSSLADDVAVGAVDTWFKTPKEYNTHWVGFAERTGLITGNYGIKSSMEAGLGSLWGEDPRYTPTDGLSTKGRVGYVIKMTFMATNRSGNAMPAYSRYIALTGSNFLFNEWMPASQATVSQALVRTGLSFLSRMSENAYKEFIARKTH
jgi:hypothetical protein